jgi:hypothetical protein
VAREIIERLVDDVDGGPAVETVSFGLDGAGYEIDLNKKNAAALRKALAAYIAAARRTTPARATKRTTTQRASAKVSNGTAGRGFDVGSLREWAAANHIQIPSRGRIPKAIVAEYHAAGGR